MTLTLKRGEQRLSFKVEGAKSNVTTLAAKIVEQIAETIKAWQ